MVIGAATLFPQKMQYFPYVVFKVSDGLQVSFLNHAQTSRDQCEKTVEGMSSAMLARCSACRVVENKCLETLDSRQKKILNGSPVDVPVMRMPDGTVAFVATSPELAQQICKESERQTEQTRPGSAQCVGASSESVALSLANVSGNATSLPSPGMLLGIALFPALVSLAIGFLIVRFDSLHSRFSHDHQTDGPQKFHAAPTPRIGGIGIAVALAGSVLVLAPLNWIKASSADGLSMLALAAIPAFAGGLAEDLTKRFGVLARLMLTISAGVLASVLVSATLDRLDIPGLDMLLLWPLFAIAFTAFAVGGVANAINIIDGYNGVAGGYAILVLGALAWVAFQVGDSVVLAASLIMIGALLGFLAWNYPKGQIFLGDGGAYLLGFWLAELSVLLVARNPDVSPWFPLLLLIYPIFETLFSVYRKKVLRGRSPGQPDGLHMHMMIYKRLARFGVGSKDGQIKTRRNSMVAPYIWCGTLIAIAPSIAIWRHTPALVVGAILFCLAYLWLYFRLARLRAPKWMISRGR